MFLEMEFLNGRVSVWVNQYTRWVQVVHMSQGDLEYLLISGWYNKVGVTVKQLPTATCTSQCIHVHVASSRH